MEKKDQEISSEEFSHIDTIECPICGSEAMTEIVHATGEENIQCHSCGYGRRLSFVDGKFDVQQNMAYGAYKVQMKDSAILDCGAFATIEAEQKFIELINYLGEKVVHAEYSKYINQKIETIVIVDGETQKTNINEQEQ